MKERIKQLRIALGLTMEKFGKQVGLTKAAISRAEAGKSNLSDVSVKSICRTYGVNEAWLRTGDGDMFINKNDAQDLHDFAEKVMLDTPESFRRRFVFKLSRLTDEQWEMLAKLVEDFTEK